MQPRRRQHTVVQRRGEADGATHASGGATQPGVPQDGYTISCGPDAASLWQPGPEELDRQEGFFGWMGRVVAPPAVQPPFERLLELVPDPFAFYRAVRSRPVARLETAAQHAAVVAKMLTLPPSRVAAEADASPVVAEALKAHASKEDLFAVAVELAWNGRSPECVRTEALTRVYQSHKAMDPVITAYLASECSMRSQQERLFGAGAVDEAAASERVRRVLETGQPESAEFSNRPLSRSEKTQIAEQPFPDNKPTTHALGLQIAAARRGLALGKQQHNLESLRCRIEDWPPLPHWTVSRSAWIGNLRDLGAGSMPPPACVVETDARIRSTLTFVDAQNVGLLGEARHMTRESTAPWPFHMYSANLGDTGVLVIDGSNDPQLPNGARIVRIDGERLKPKDYAGFRERAETATEITFICPLSDHETIVRQAQRAYVDAARSGVRVMRPSTDVSWNITVKSNGPPGAPGAAGSTSPRMHRHVVSQSRNENLPLGAKVIAAGGHALNVLEHTAAAAAIRAATELTITF